MKQERNRAAELVNSHCVTNHAPGLWFKATIIIHFSRDFNFWLGLDEAACLSSAMELAWVSEDLFLIWGSV